MRDGLADAQYLLAHVLSPQLSERVPTDIAKLFEVARGAMCYAYFFYPLWTLAAEQLFRVAEAAVSLRCKGLGAGRGVSTFERKIRFLQDRLPLSSPPVDWNAIRFLRNEASHPQQQTIISPGMAVPLVEAVALALNHLFAAA